MRNAYQPSTACRLGAIYCCPNNPTGRARVDALTLNIPVLSVLNGSNHSPDSVDQDYGANLCEGEKKQVGIFRSINVKLHFLIPRKKFLFGCKSLFYVIGQEGIVVFFVFLGWPQLRPAEKNKSQVREGENTSFSSTHSATAA